MTMEPVQRLRDYWRSACFEERRDQVPAINYYHIQSSNELHFILFEQLYHKLLTYHIMWNAKRNIRPAMFWYRCYLLARQMEIRNCSNRQVHAFVSD